MPLILVKIRASATLRLRLGQSVGRLLRQEPFFPNVPIHFQGNMADATNKYPENVPGKFYVDDQCIDCDLCRETAPANFKRNDDGGHSYVYKQPESPEEEGLCKEAMEGCPVEAIGNDGNGA
jgi:ferredoxin